MLNIESELEVKMLALERSRYTELNKFFRNVVSHWVADNVYKPDTAFCNCRVSAKIFNVSGAAHIHIDEEPPKEFLIDINNPSLGWRTYAAAEGGDWTTIWLVSDQRLHLVGLYRPASHTLVATNWIDSPDSSPLIRLIAEAMGWPPRYNIPDDPPPTAMLGADAEFECWLPGSGIVLPSNEDTYEGEHGEVGLDGSRDVCEARPLPTPDPAELYWRIRTLIKEWEAATGYRACLSGHDFPIGCHIHLGGPTGWRLVGDFSQFIIKADDHVGFVLELSGDARGCYYNRAAWREKPHGLEYRTPPSSILAFPDTFIWIASVMKAIAAGGPPPATPKRVAEQFEAIDEAIARRLLFTFELERLGDPVLHRITLSRDSRFGRELVEWVHSLNQSERVLHDVHIFGYARHHGHVTNIPVIAEAMGWELAETPPRYAGASVIGLPYDFRTAPVIERLRKLEMALVQIGVLSRR